MSICCDTTSTEDECVINEKTLGTYHDIVVLECHGKLVKGGAALVLRNRVRMLVSEDVRKIILNMNGIEYIDANGIGELVSSYTVVKNVGGLLVLLGLTQKVEDLLAITRLHKVFESYQSEDEAVHSLENREFVFVK